LSPCGAIGCNGPSAAGCSQERRNRSPDCPWASKTDYPLITQPINGERVPVIQFDREGNVGNGLDIMYGRDPIKEATDITGPMFTAYLYREEFVISNYAGVGAFWGLVHVEIRKMGIYPNGEPFYFGCIVRAPESKSINYRETSFYFTGLKC
jgi:hypothetical protein